MTALLGGSVALIAAAAIALVLGWSESEEPLVWGAIAGALGAGVLLAIALLRSRVAPARSGREDAERAGSPQTTTATLTPAGAHARPSKKTGAPRPAAATAATATSGAATGRKSTATPAAKSPAGKPTKKPAAPKAPKAPKAAASGGAAAGGAAAAAGGAIPAPDVTAKKKTPERTGSTPATPRSRPKTEATAPAAKPVERKAKQGEVVAVPDRKKFHRPECRYAKANGAERMSKATARRRSYAACGVCKP